MIKKKQILDKKQITIGELKMKETKQKEYKMVTTKQMYAINLKLAEKADEIAKFVEPAISVKPEGSEKDIVITNGNIDFEYLVVKPNMEAGKASALFDNEGKVIETPTYDKKQK